MTRAPSTNPGCSTRLTGAILCNCDVGPGGRRQNGASAVVFDSPTNLLVDAGTVTAGSAGDGFAVQACFGDTTIVNTGVLNGSVQLASPGANLLDNRAGGALQAGPVLDLGGGQRRHRRFQRCRSRRQRPPDRRRRQGRDRLHLPGRDVGENHAPGRHRTGGAVARRSLGVLRWSRRRAARHRLVRTGRATGRGPNSALDAIDRSGGRAEAWAMAFSARAS